MLSSSFRPSLAHTHLCPICPLRDEHYERHNNVATHEDNNRPAYPLRCNVCHVLALSIYGKGQGQDDESLRETIKNNARHGRKDRGFS